MSKFKNETEMLDYIKKLEKENKYFTEKRLKVRNFQKKNFKKYYNKIKANNSEVYQRRLEKNRIKARDYYKKNKAKCLEYQKNRRNNENKIKNMKNMKSMNKEYIKEYNRKYYLKRKAAKLKIEEDNK